MAIGVINDVDELKRFRDQLLDTTDKLEEDWRRTDDAIETVAQKWKDSQFQKFESDFNNDREVIKPLCSEIKEYEELLYDLEKKIRNYLDYIL